jgi:hypothetical protein
MWSPEFSNDIQTTDDIDPGKDIFALLFLSFFLINAVLLFCISKQGEQTTNINTAGTGGKKTIQSSFLATIKRSGKKIVILQDNKAYSIPNDIHAFKTNAHFDIRFDKKGNKHLTLFAEDPGKTMTAGEMLRVVQILNSEKIGVDFRTVINRGGNV